MTRFAGMWPKSKPVIINQVYALLAEPVGRLELGLWSAVQPSLVLVHRGKARHKRAAFG